MNKQEQIKELKKTIEEAKRQVEELEKGVEGNFPLELIDLSVVLVRHYDEEFECLVSRRGVDYFLTVLDGRYKGVSYAGLPLPLAGLKSKVHGIQLVANSLEEYYREKFKRECEKVYADFFGWVSSADTPSQGDYYKL